MKPVPTKHAGKPTKHTEELLNCTWGTKTLTPSIKLIVSINLYQLDGQKCALISIMKSMRVLNRALTSTKQDVQRKISMRLSMHPN